MALFDRVTGHDSVSLFDRVAQTLRCTHSSHRPHGSTLKTRDIQLFTVLAPTPITQVYF